MPDELETQAWYTHMLVWVLPDNQTCSDQSVGCHKPKIPKQYLNSTFVKFHEKGRLLFDNFGVKIP